MVESIYFTPGGFMKIIILRAALIVCVSFLALTPAYSSDGTINFTGTIVASTCVINGGGTNATFSVVLPSVDASALSVAGKTATPTPFTFNLTNCPATGPVHAQFEIGGNVDTNTGNLKNTGSATGVEISLLNSTFAAINVYTLANDGTGTGAVAS